MRGPTAPQALLAFGALLAPIYGGYVASDGTKVDPSDFVGSLGVGQAPILQHALIALPVFLAMAWLLVARRVQQIPHPYVAGALALFVAGLAPSVAVSSYRAVAVNAWMEWVAYAVAFLACVSGLGRRLGPIAILGAVFAGTAWIARIGVLEYLDMRRIDPTWRVFCGWNNPNAAAAMLTLGFFCALGLPRPSERSAGLLVNLAAVVGGTLILTALALTGSKGATLLALPTGLVAFGLVAGRRHWIAFPVALLVLALAGLAFFKSMPLLGVGASLLFAVGCLASEGKSHPATAGSRWIPLARLASTFVLAWLMLGFFASTTPKGTGITGASRIGGAAADADQSATFRLNLWKSAAALTKERPVTGWGLGSFRYESARPGLVTATVFSHNSYLQIAAEAGVGAVVLFLVFLGLWARRSLRGSSRLPEGQRLALASAAGGLAAILAHCLVDSDFSTFGLGLAFFLVLGAASLLAADGVAPEFIPLPSRYVAAGGVAALWTMLLWLALGDDAKSAVRFAQAAGQPSDVASLDGLAGWDGDAAYLWSWAQGPNAEAAYKRTLEIHPTPKVARLLAKLQADHGEYLQAETTLSTALTHDPNNLLALLQLMGVQQASSDLEGAMSTAKRLVGVEQKPYFTIRSIPESVPTETYRARLFLASQERSPIIKARLLAEAVRGLRRYAEITVPQVVHATKDNPRSDFNGETLSKVHDRCTEGVGAAQEASRIFRAAGNERAAVDMDEDAAILAKAAG